MKAPAVRGFRESGAQQRVLNTKGEYGRPRESPGDSQEERSPTKSTSVRNRAVYPSWASTRTEDISWSCPVISRTCPTSWNKEPRRTTLCSPIQLSSKLAPQVRPKNQDGRHCVVPHRPLSSPIILRHLLLSSAVFQFFCCFPPSPAVPHCPRWSYVVTCRPLGEVASGRGTSRPYKLRQSWNFKDEDGIHFVIPSGHFLKVPTQ